MRTLLLAAAALALATPGLSGAGAGDVVIVDMININFDPLVVEVHVGDTVRWVNIDGIEHTSTATPLWDSGEMLDGDTFEHRFDVPGTFPYRCIYHIFMVGAVVVQP